MNDRIEWTWAPIFNSPWLTTIVVVFLVMSLVLLREDRALSRGQKGILFFLRLLLIVLVCLGLYRPGLTFVSKSAPKNAVAVMIDLSQSMELSASNTGRTRWQAQDSIWRQIYAAKEQLGKETSLVLYGYDDQLRSIDALRVDHGERALEKIRPEGGLTEIGRPLSQLMAAQSEPPLSAILWMGDATQTVSPASNDAQQVARQLQQLDIPLMLFGLGPQGDGERIKDIALTGVPEEIEVSAGNRTSVAGLVRAQGVIHRELPIQMRILSSDGTWENGPQDLVRVEKNDQNIPFRLPLTAPENGSFELEVSVPVEDGELLSENNRAICFLNVRKGGSRVLYLEGNGLREEFVFVPRSLADNPDFQVDKQWIQPPPNNEWPLDLTAAIGASTYNAFILGDLDASALTNESWALLADRVKKGAGLITLGGFQAYGPGGYAETPLAEILPIEMDARFRHRLGTPQIEEMHYWGEIQLKPKRTHEVTTLGDITENLKNWQSLPPVIGANKWSAIKTLPGVQVLLEGSKGEPMMVAGDAERGRVLSLAFDSTFRWVRRGKSELHRQFWRQLVLWVIRRESAEESIEIRMSKRRLFRQQSVDVSIQWTPGPGGGTIPEGVRMKLFRDGQEVDGVLLSRKDDRTSIGKLIAPNVAGRYELRASAPSSSGNLLEATLPFIVLEQSAETQQPLPDFGLMNQLAAITESSGGCLLAEEDVDIAMERLAERRTSAIVELVQSYRLGDGTLDSWVFFLCLLGLLSIQWLLRKRWNLA